MSVGWVGGLAAASVLVVVARLVLRGRLNVKYAALWLSVVLGVALLGLVPGLLVWSSDLLGFELPANFLFSTGLLLLLLVGINLSVAVTALEAKVQRLAEEVALLREQEGRRDGTG